MKLSLKKSWLCRLIQDLSPTTAGSSRGIVNNGVTKYGHLDDLPMAIKIVGLSFAVFGVAATLYLSCSCILSIPSSQPPVENPPGSITNDDTSEDTCSTTLPLIDDVITRLHILEIAFKEQTFARETIAREVSDQTNTYESLEKKIASVLDRLTNISSLFSDLQMKFDQLERKANFNETLVIALFLCIVCCLLWYNRKSIHEYVEKLEASYRSPIPKKIESTRVLVRKSSSNPGTPKHSSSLLNEVCMVCFQPENTNGIIAKLTNAMLRHLEGFRVSLRPFYGVLSFDDIRDMPHVRLYVIIVDAESRGLFLNCSDKDLLVECVNRSNTIGACCVVIIINDDGSKNLTAHSVFNSSLRLIKTSDCLQDMAAKGRLFSLWKDMTSHQLSHLRRIVKTVLNAKLVLK
ncbi:uncharacterized protein LOC127848537 [Dreissena polymorpha]|uniref:Uncharacterized protein n=1 Tax=Dreissena polymorpha TaxID=45954 RepID=A0A9D4DD01_DREPO|nr:uncharacterized protein LOC127848537 [Dreissena polymorpha]KAH3746586.1 hypothetical protein DPMN_180995 [Dreissena polymorpha]